MKLCEKCHTENYDEAAYCKNCGHILEMGKTKQVVKFQTTFLKLNVFTILALRLFILSSITVIVSLFLQYLCSMLIINNYFILSTTYKLLHLFFLLILFSIPLSIIFFLIYNKRWKKFYLNSDLKNAKEKLTAFVFSQNTSKETIKIRENSKDELRLKDKSLGAKGYFHLVTDKDGNVLLIGEKYNTQNLIRKVFGKEINFLETK